MRFALLCLLITATAAAADQVTVTLADGRELTGVWDADAETITTDKPRAVIKVAKKDVVEVRKAATPPPAAPTPAPKTEKSVAEAWKDVVAQEQAAQLAAHQAKLAGTKAVLQRLDLRPINTPKLGADPRQSEVKAAARISDINRIMADMARVLDGDFQRYDERGPRGGFSNEDIGRFIDSYPEIEQLRATYGTSVPPR